jgi:CRP/FNR family transcriptional regulator
MRATRNVRPYAYLIKPFDRDEFRRTFAVALARREEDADELPLIKDEWPKELSADGEESISQLMKFQSFAKLSKDAVRTLFEHSQIEELDSGKFFLNYVDSYDPYIPISGRLAVIESPSDGKELISNLLVAGDSFGFLPLESNFYSTRIVRAQLDSKVMVFSRSVYESVLEKNAALKTNLIIDLSNRLSSAYAFEASLAHVRVEARIVTSLLGLIPKLGKDSAGKKEIRLFLTRKELADLIGTTVETAIRLTKHLEREGYLDLTRAGIIKILDVEKLQALESNR